MLTVDPVRPVTGSEDGRQGIALIPIGFSQDDIGVVAKSTRSGLAIIVVRPISGCPAYAIERKLGYSRNFVAKAEKIGGICAEKGKAFRMKAVGWPAMFFG